MFEKWKCLLVVRRLTASGEILRLQRAEGIEDDPFGGLVEDDDGSKSLLGVTTAPWNSSEPDSLFLSLQTAAS